MGVNMSSVWQNTVCLWTFSIKKIFLETLPLISLDWLCYMLDSYPHSNKNGLSRVTFSSKGPMRGQYVFLMANIVILISIIISTDSGSYFLKKSMLTSLLGTLTEARMGVCRVTFLSKGPMSGQYVFLTAKYILFIDVFYFSYYFRRLSLIFP